MQTFRAIGGLCKHTCRTHPHYFRLIVSVKIYITPAVRDPHLLRALLLMVYGKVVFIHLILK